VGFTDLMDSALGACTSVLGEQVSYTPQGGSAVTINGIFDNRFIEIGKGGGMPVMSRRPTLGIRNSDLLALPAIDDQVVVRGTTYKVIETDDGGDGSTLLILARTS